MRILPAGLAVCAMVLGGAPLFAEAEAPPRIVIDSVHANNYLSGGLTSDNYSYHQQQGFRRAFEYLTEQAVVLDEMKSGRLDAARLEGARLLFINLPSAERPPFLVSEIAAIRSFVSDGGSLLAVTDHSNCYFHAHRLEPLFAELDIASFTDTACDVPPNTIGGGNAWLAISRFNEHPVTRELKWLGIQTGGRVDPRHAVAFTSDDAWADRWLTSAYGEDNAPGFYGDFRFVIGEDHKRLGVVLAKPFERGKIVVIADQNMLGDPFLHYADNYRLWLNAAAWLLDDENLADPNKYLSRRPRRVTFFERCGETAFGSGDHDGYLNAFGLVSRTHWAFATDRLDDCGDLLVLAHDDVRLTAEEAGRIAERLKEGKRVLVLGLYFETLHEPGAATAAILAALGEKAVETSSPDRIVVTVPGGGKLTALRETGAFQNAFLSQLTVRPKPEEEERGRLLLREIDNCLND